VLERLRFVLGGCVGEGTYHTALKVPMFTFTPVCLRSLQCH